MRAYAFLPPDDIDRKVEACMQRQETLTHRTPPTLSFVIEETTVQCLIGTSHVFGPQIQHLINVAEGSPHASIQIMPLRSGLHGALGSSFVILYFNGDFDLSIVHAETAIRSGHLGSKEEVALQQEHIHPSMWKISLRGRNRHTAQSTPPAAQAVNCGTSPMHSSTEFYIRPFRAYSYSSADGNCVEMADGSTGAAIRDTKHRELGALSFDAS